jgi:hypothetical protein
MKNLRMQNHWELKLYTASCPSWESWRLWKDVNAFIALLVFYVFLFENLHEMYRASFSLHMGAYYHWVIIKRFGIGQLKNS